MLEPADSYGKVVFGDGPIAWYRDAGLYESITGVASGSNVGSPQAVAGIAKQSNNAATYFPTVNDYITHPDRSDLQLVNTSFSVEFWVTIPDPLPATPTWPGVLGKGFGSSGGWLAYYARPAAKLSFKCNPPSDNSLITVVPGKTYHIAFVFDNVAGKLRAYRNGEFQGEAAFTGPTGTTSQFRLGNSAEGGGLNWGLDEVAIYNYALTPERISLHYEVGAGNVDPWAPVPSADFFRADSLATPIFVQTPGRALFADETVSTPDSLDDIIDIAGKSYAASTGWADLGATKGGLRIQRQIANDGYSISDGRITTMRSVSSVVVETALADASMAGLASAWGNELVVTGNDSIIGGGITPNSALKRLAIAHQVRNACGEVIAIRAYIFPLAAKSLSEQQIPFGKSGEQQVLPVRFKAVPDPTEVDLEKRYFYVLEESV